MLTAMKFLRSILDFYIQSSIHVGLAVMSIAVLSVMQLGFVPEPTLLLFIWLGTICGYNFVKYAGISNRHHLQKTNNILLIRLFSVCCFAGFLYFGQFLPSEVWYTSGFFGALTGLYAIPFLWKRNLRSIKGLKIFIIATVWVGMAVVVPLQYHHMGFGERTLYQMAEIFLFVVMLMLPFEIRDLKYDEPELATIPQVLGVKKTKWLGTFLAVVLAVIILSQQYVYENYLPVNLTVVAVALLFVWLSSKNQGNYYASFWVEGIPIAWLIAYLYT
ncbi:MAG: hypothetical protein CL670_09590 [Balneola sp.]|jgi:hypothetical protein|nr:hypothetical protein [Balneola sp.]MBE79394.1 hypothetical protein [Balneola sp.]|tara:strand:+ start:383 stop:1204 length:822 start_codon:yes stop_codon:yes gene_type:complete